MEVNNCLRGKVAAETCSLWIGKKKKQPRNIAVKNEQRNESLVEGDMRPLEGFAFSFHVLACSLTGLIQ